MFFTGFTDEAAKEIDKQIQALQLLGWSNMESRNTEYGNIAAMNDEQFENFKQKLSDANITVNCYGSGIANWQKSIFDSPESSYEELKIAIPRLQTLGTKMVRVMSFKCPEDESINTPEIENEVIRRMKTLTSMAEDSGLILVHENCDNWGGRSWEHTLRLLDAIQSPSFRLVFDTGNPVFRKDIRFASKAPWPYQDAWEFFTQVEEFVDYIHIKDGTMKNGSMHFTWPGEGDGCVEKILQALLRKKYSGGISIEPHMVSVHHDKDNAKTNNESFENFVNYGQKVENLIEKINQSEMELA